MVFMLAIFKNDLHHKSSNTREIWSISIIYHKRIDKAISGSEDLPCVNTYLSKIGSSSGRLHPPVKNMLEIIIFILVLCAI
ncbi:hypothetical protein GWI33_015882 [Rhynchophorus ferrugineus]|uniref:Uncharacterized protein n=1 Tax=Rhynchophorus ferrugineus TaxID=354439 RepID=A0A834HZ36_RHYFE|nr:hypothetical protein GWI33_015882 [Rhynchophorus ferrugineus]